ncbi:MAG: ligand-binding protein SH3 [Dictyoglomus sp. NZ13-RE01]|nr:MAG: ligand-binding protein SH3 [Dictyoglomus sp. NZ13-RE01]
MNVIVKVFLLSMTPIGECRVSIPFGIYNGLSPFEAFVISFLGNTLMGILIYWAIDLLKNIILNRDPFKNPYEKFVKSKLNKLKIYSLGVTFSLAIFIGMPPPGTGAFTGAILSKVLGLNFKQAFLAISSGVFIASTIVTFLTLSSKAVF